MSLLLFNLPEFNRDQLTSCELKLDALETWLSKLPLAHPKVSYQQLNSFLTEFNQLNFLPLRRLEWLNIIQPQVLKTTQSLDTGSHLLEEGDLAQTLQNQLAQGYKRVVNDLLKLREQLPAAILARSLLQAIFAALEQTSELILRSFLFSIEAPENSWAELNLLYHLACQSRLQHKNLQTKAPQNCEQLYFQATLLALIQAQTLRKDEINQLYPLLAQWSQQLNRLAVDHPSGLFIISAKHHFIPKRGKSSGNKTPKNHLISNTKSRSLALDTRSLAENLAANLTSYSHLSKRLTQHLVSSLGELSNRITPRIDSDEPLTLALGLRSVHFHMNNKRTLDSLIAGNNLTKKITDNPFITTISDDPWSAAFDAGENTDTGDIQLVEMDTHLSTSLDEELSKRYPIHQLQQVNASATGYCVFWSGDPSTLLKTGELIAFKEQTNDPWQAGLIRWIREVPLGHQLGIERLGGRMQPCAVKLIIKVGEPRDFMPGFLIPELQVLGIPAGLITPLLPFRQGQKVEISFSQGVEEAKLVELISSPGEFNHFQLESLGNRGLSLH